MIYMKAKKVLLVVSMMFCFGTSSAQIFKLRNNAGSDTYFGLVKWSDRKLRWDDFKGHKPATMSKKASYISLKSMPVEQKKEIDGIYYKYIDFESYMVQNASWLDAKDINDSRLKLCQNQFDVWEYLGRERAIRYAQSQSSSNLVWEEMTMDFERLAKEMDVITDYGRNGKAVDSIANELAKVLPTKELDPRELSKGLKPSIVNWQGDVGLVCGYPFSDYLSMTYGFSGGISYNRKKMLYGFDLDVALCKSNKHIFASKGEIKEGDVLFHGGMTLYLGYNAYNRNKVSLTPFVGAGVRFLDGGDKYEEYQEGKNDKIIELAGFSTGVGMMIDYKIKHTINSKDRWMGIIATETQIRVKPYFSITNYRNDLGWVPAINLSVGINGKSYRMKK